MNIAILILAAGSSSRMGEPKQLLSFKNTTLLGYAIEQAQKSNSNKVFCVLGAHADKIKASLKDYNNIEIILNTNFKLGLSSSIIKGLEIIRNKPIDALLIMLADQPKMNTAYLNQLISSFLNHSNKISASIYSGIYGVPAIFPRQYFEELLKLEGDKGAKVFLNTNKTKIIAIKSDKLNDIDTPDDYLNFLNSI